ncbi:hypothetical protein LACFE_CDS0552 [Limosilactobacillus fermentum]|uniref:Uncharacterized protein n=1 Tax=Limosilactobacillus fermentum TaxID=1613 RepID=A0A1D7ZVY5_LIMFE|nr:hypothetical protein LACFE_CDS0552 [Limosilactobacillus fermentum]
MAPQTDSDIYVTLSQLHFRPKEKGQFELPGTKIYKNFTKD